MILCRHLLHACIFLFLGEIQCGLRSLKNSWIRIDVGQVVLRMELLSRNSASRVERGGGEFSVYVCYPQADDINKYERIIYFAHGGSFNYGSMRTYGSLIRAFAKNLNAVIVAPMYNLAPTYKWPAQVFEVLDGYEWLLNSVGDCFESSFSLIPQVGEAASDTEIRFRSVPIYGMGDSAGGNIMSVLPLMLYDFALPQFEANILLYPATLLMEYPTQSRALFSGKKGGHFILEEQQVQEGIRMYFDNLDQASHRYASPLLADIPAEYPPTLLVAAEADPLRDDSLLFHEKLLAFNIKTRLHIVRKTVHAFLNMPWLNKNKITYEYIEMFLKDVESKKLK